MFGGIAQMPAKQIRSLFGSTLIPSGREDIGPLVFHVGNQPTKQLLLWDETSSLPGPTIPIVADQILF